MRAIAESVAPLCGAGVLAALLRHLLPVLRDSCRDAEEDCRNNAVFALGELLLWGGQELGQHRGSILASLTQMLKVGIHQNHQRSLLPSLCQTESCPSVLDNLAGALARAVTADVSGPGVAELVEEVRARLPLQEDLEEYETIFKMFSALQAASNPAFSQCLPEMVESAAIFYSDPTIDKVSNEGETRRKF